MHTHGNTPDLLNLHKIHQTWPRVSGQLVDQIFQEIRTLGGPVTGQSLHEEIVRVLWRHEIAERMAEDLKAPAKALLDWVIVAEHASVHTPAHGPDYYEKLEGLARRFYFEWQSSCSEAR